jgi:hypothetical protein
VLLLNECLFLFISLSTQPGNFWIHLRMFVCVCVSMNMKTLCLIWSESTVLFWNNTTLLSIRIRNTLTHKKNYKTVSVFSGGFRKGLESPQNVVRKQSNDRSSALRTNYRVARFLAKEGKPFSDGEFVRKCLQHVAREICPKMEAVFNTVSLSRATWRNELQISVELEKKAK